MTVLDPSTWTPAERSILDTLRGLLIETNAIDAHAHQYNGTYGAVDAALTKALQVAISTHQPELAPQALAIAQEIIAITIDHGDSVSHTLDLIEDGYFDYDGDIFDAAVGFPERHVFTDGDGVSTIEVSYDGESVTVVTDLGYVDVLTDYQRSWDGSKVNTTSAALTAVITANPKSDVEAVGYRNENSGSFRFQFAEGEESDTWASIEFLSTTTNAAQA